MRNCPTWRFLAWNIALIAGTTPGIILFRHSSVKIEKPAVDFGDNPGKDTRASSEVIRVSHSLSIKIIALTVPKFTCRWAELVSQQWIILFGKF